MKLDKLFLYVSIFILLGTIAWIFAPSNKVRYHLILTGMGRARVHPYKARFKPYSGKTMGGAVLLSSALKKTKDNIKEGAYNFISMGTELSGTADAYFTKGKTIVDIMNGLGVQGMLLSNIDFTYGVERLKELKEDMNFEFIGSNIVQEGTMDTPDWLCNKLILEPKEGFKVGFLGISPVNTASLVAQESIEGLEFLHPIPKIKNIAKTMREDGVSLIVLLTQYSKEHITLEEWQGIQVIGPDLCVMLDQDLEAPKPFVRDGILVSTISSYNQTKELDVLSLELELNPLRIVGLAKERIPVNEADFEKDGKMQKVVEDATKDFRELRETHLANFAGEYSRSYNYECLIGNFVTDAVRKVTGAEIAFQNSGGIQYNIASGSFTIGDLYALLPFDNQVFMVEMLGKDILDVLKIAASRQRGVLQVSGLSYGFVFKNSKDFELKVATLADGLEIDEEKSYKVALNNFLYHGGDNFAPFKNSKLMEESLTLRKVLKKYMAEFQDLPIELSYEDRIIIEE